MTHSDEWLKENFDYRFLKKDLFEAELTHRSADSRHNERLEFLGDSVLNTVVSDALYKAAPDAREGDLSRIRASLVNGKTLGQIAADISLGRHLNLGSGELKSGGFRRPSILADALEAVIGAIYLDGGFNAAADSIRRLYGERLKTLPTAEELKDPKTRLQEFLQGKGLSLPAYEVLNTLGEPHDQTFSVQCRVESPPRTTNGLGKSRRDAEQEAARQMFAQLQNE